MIGQVEKELNKALKWSGFTRKDIPKPETLLAEGLYARDYHRLSVAYGLSFSFDDIGKIVPPSEIGDIPLVKTNRKYDFIAKEMV